MNGFLLLRAFDFLGLRPTAPRPSETQKSVGSGGREGGGVWVFLDVGFGGCRVFLATSYYEKIAKNSKILLIVIVILTIITITAIIILIIIIKISIKKY